MIKCDICNFRHDIYCNHPKANKFMLCGYIKVPDDCPLNKQADDEYNQCENCPNLQTCNDDICP